MDDVLVERVLRAAECVPPGRVTSYGQIGALVGTGPRQVGAIMSAWGENVPWWRVTNARGRLPSHLIARAREHWNSEGTPLTPDGDGCAMRSAAADPGEFAVAVHAATADLGPPAG